MTSDLLLLEALIDSLGLTDRALIAAARSAIDHGLQTGQTRIPIAGVPVHTVKVRFDHTVFMFCYPWRGRHDPYPDENATRQPVTTRRDQSTEDYGHWSFDTARDHAIDVMVGYWNVDNPTVFNHFQSSIAWYTDGRHYDGPKVAYSMEFADADKDTVKQHLEHLFSQEIGRERYYRFRDRTGALRFPLIFWGTSEVGPNDTVDITLMQNLSARLDDIRGRTIGGATPFIIWESHLLDVAAGPNVPASFRPMILDKIDAFYQHACFIPNPPGTWGQVDRHNWAVFPHAQLDAEKTVEATRTMKGRANGLGKIAIPGTMPQYSRERLTAAHAAPAADISQARVNCTDVHQVRLLLRLLKNEAETIHVDRTGPGALTVRRMMALTSWNEWPEGSTWEPCDANNLDWNAFGMTDVAGDLLNEVKGAFKPAVVPYMLGGGGHNGGGHNGGGHPT